MKRVANPENWKSLDKLCTIFPMLDKSWWSMSSDESDDSSSDSVHGQGTQ